MVTSVHRLAEDERAGRRLCRTGESVDREGLRGPARSGRIHLVAAAAAP